MTDCVTSEVTEFKAPVYFQEKKPFLLPRANVGKPLAELKSAKTSKSPSTGANRKYLLAPKVLRTLKVSTISLRYFPEIFSLRNKKERMFELSAGTLESLAQIEAYETPNLANNNDDMDMDENTIPLNDVMKITSMFKHMTLEKLNQLKLRVEAHKEAAKRIGLRNC